MRLLKFVLAALGCLSLLPANAARSEPVKIRVAFVVPIANWAPLIPIKKEDMLRIERWYLDPKNHDEVAKIAGGILKMPPARFGWVFTKQDYYRDPNGLPDLDALQRSVDTAADLGFLKSSIDVKKYADLSIVKEAAARLK